MMNILNSLIPYLNAIVTVCGLMVLYGLLLVPLERIFYVQKQPILRSETTTDAAYWFISYGMHGFIAAILSLLIYSFSFGKIPTLPQALIFTSWPICGQVLGYLFLADFVQYWIHRAMHYEPLWTIHAVHHSSEELDWLSGYRRHPIEKVSLSLYGLLFLPTPEAANVVVITAPLLSLLPHANLNWTFGPLKYVLVSPVYHRWHHTHPDEGGMRNYAGIFSCIDLVFGTFHMPKERMPVTCGTTGKAVPKNVFAQLVYPFITFRPAVK